MNEDITDKKKISRYRRRIIMASIGLHIAGLLALFVYWLLGDPFSQDISNVKVAPPVQENTPGGGEEKLTKSTEKDPKLPYKEGDLKDGQLLDIINNNIKQNQNLTEAEKIEKLNENLAGISRTSVKEVEKMTNLVKEVTDVEISEKSTLPIRERKLGEAIDEASMILYDFERNGDMITLIYKDKNNIIIKNDPESYNELDPGTRFRISLLQKAKENKKFQLLHDTTNALIDKLYPDPTKKESPKE